MSDKYITDHLFGFVSWLTTLENSLLVGMCHSPDKILDLLKRYIDENNLPDVSKNYPNTFNTPKKKFNETKDFELT